jgi:hypothetical protein
MLATDDLPSAPACIRAAAGLLNYRAERLAGSRSAIVSLVSSHDHVWTHVARLAVEGIIRGAA